MIHLLPCCHPEERWKEVDIVDEDRKEHHLLQNQETQATYKPIGELQVAQKLVTLVVITPLYGTAYISLHALRAVVYPLLRLLGALAILVKTHFWLGWSNLLKEVAPELPLFFMRTIWTVVKTPFYCLALEFAALYGLVWSPYQGMALFGAVEQSLHEGKGQGLHLFNGWIRGKRSEENFRELHRKIVEFFYNPDHQITLFLAVPFQAVQVRLPKNQGDVP